MKTEPKRGTLAGKRVELVKCNDSFTSLKPGEQGTIMFVDDLDTVHIKWDNGNALGLCRDDGDRWIVLD